MSDIMHSTKCRPMCVCTLQENIKAICFQGDDDDEEELEASEAKLELEKAETMQKIKDINKLENRDKDLMLYEHGENIKNNQEKGISSY